MKPTWKRLVVAITLWVSCSAAAGPAFYAANLIALARLRARDLPMPDVSDATARELGPGWRLPLRARLVPDDVRTPGDPRPYRHGVHQGTDFYGVDIGEPVYPVATGLVVRADTRYTRMTAEYRRALLARCREVGATPGELGAGADPKYGDILDKLRGRQVWLYHGDTHAGLPVLSVYAHLSDVTSVKLGEYVSSDRRIGSVGASGTSDEGSTSGAHLHLEIYVGDEYWTPRDPGERGHVQASARRLELRRATLRALGWSRLRGDRRDVE